MDVAGFFNLRTAISYQPAARALPSAIVRVVGAMPLGQASGAGGKTNSKRADRIKVLFKRLEMPITGIAKRV